MKLKRFKERDPKRIGILVFTIACIMLVTGVILYRTFAIFEVKTVQNIINGTVHKPGDIQFMVYVDENLTKDVPTKEQGYTLDTFKSHCENGSLVSWNYDKWSVEIKNISTTRTKCYLYFDKIYLDETLKQGDGSAGPIPDLGNGKLIPIKIDTSTETPVVKKANIFDEWYNYSKKEWANAVILRDGLTDTYNPGDVIQEKDIESYFVWIPRYKYQLKNSEEELNKYENGKDDKGIIQTDIKNYYESIQGNKGTEAYTIQFETVDRGVTKGQSKNDWLTHPAFVSFNCNGFWVGKFETGYNQNENTNTSITTDGWSFNGAEKDIQDASDKIIIKPNVYSWRGIKVAAAFYNSYDYQRSLDSHMMKNMEWGAIAYLTQSKYGRCEENVNCTEVRINNSSSYVTGSSAVNEPLIGYTGYSDYASNELGQDKDSIVVNYNNSKSVQSSTTNNYYGIFDMSGGAYEYVMGVMQIDEDDARPASGTDSTNNSGFNGPYSNCNIYDGTEECNGITENVGKNMWPEKKYYDSYEHNMFTKLYKIGHLGDATKENGPFYFVKFVNSSAPTRYLSSYNADAAFFLYPGAPWVIRGGRTATGTDAGIFSFDIADGYLDNNRTFRIVLTP